MVGRNIERNVRIFDTGKKIRHGGRHREKLWLVVSRFPRLQGNTLASGEKKNNMWKKIINTNF